MGAVAFVWATVGQVMTCVYRRACDPRGTGRGRVRACMHGETLPQRGGAARVDGSDIRLLDEKLGVCSGVC